MISHNCLYAPGARTLLSTSFLRSVDPGGIFGDGHGGTVVWLSGGSDLQQLAATRPNGDLHILGTRGDDGLIVLKVDDLSASVRSKLRSAGGAMDALFGRVQGPEAVFASSSRTSSEDPLWDVPVAGNAAVRLAHERAGRAPWGTAHAGLAEGRETLCSVPWPSVSLPGVFLGQCSFAYLPLPVCHCAAAVQPGAVC